MHQATPTWCQNQGAAAVGPASLGNRSEQHVAHAAGQQAGGVWTDPLDSGAPSCSPAHPPLQHRLVHRRPINSHRQVPRCTPVLPF